MSSEVSATIPDWSRESRSRFWHPSAALLQSIRDYQRHAADRRPWSPVLKRLAVLRHRFWSVVAGADIPLNCQLGGGLLLLHPQGIVLHSTAKVGPNCLILQQVTMTQNVELGGHVDVGAGAKILHGAKVGDHATIGANAVVLHDVPAGATAVGVPARILPAKADAVEEPSLVQPIEAVDQA